MTDVEQRNFSTQLMRCSRVDRLIVRAERFI
jgi:hypothetical protein